MTWIIGASTPFGYAMGVADIQVSWGNHGPRHDCLRKVYQVAPFLLAGFSGSVRMGFRLLDDLVQYLSPDPEPGESWMPRWVALKWYRRARRLFAGAPEAEQELGSSILLLGVRPRDSSGCIIGGRPDVVRFSSRVGFKPEFVPLGHATSIGSGNNVELYMRELTALQANPLVMMQGEVGSPGGYGRAWAGCLARTLRANQEPGVSQYLHFFRVWRDRIELGPLDLSRITADGVSADFPMPDVVNGWPAFEEYSRNVRLSAAAARA